MFLLCLPRPLPAPMVSFFDLYIIKVGIIIINTTLPPVILCLYVLSEGTMLHHYYSSHFVIFFHLQDNQLRSRVFAERLGLEADWNCHISLADPTPDVSSRSISRTSNRVGQLASIASAATLSASNNGRVRETSVSTNHGESIF